MRRIVKIVLLAGLLVAASYLLGTICRRIEREYELIFAPSLKLAILLLECLAGVGAVAVASGLVATLVRPLSICALIFLFAATTLLLSWKVSMGTGILALLYFLILLLYAVKTTKELEERVHFSVQAVAGGFPLLLTTLALIACSGIYFSYTTKIKVEGFSIPTTLTDTFTGIIMQRVSAQMRTETEGALKPDEEEKQLAEIREQIEGMWLKPLESRIKPYERFIPAALALGLFLSLRTLLVFFTWLPTLILRGLFSLITILNLAKVVRETREVERLVIE